MRTIGTVVAVIILAGQTADPPPAFKMGLWESTTVTVPMGATGAVAAKMKEQHKQIGAAITTRWRLCFSAESWEASINAMTAQGSCKVRKREVTGHGAVLSATCNSGGGKLEVDYKAVYDSMEAMHTSTTSTIEFPEKDGGGSMVVNDTAKQKFVSADCGSIAPGKKVEIP